MHMQREHQVLGVAQVSVPVGQLHPQRKTRQQHEHGRADVAGETFLEAFQLTRHGLGVDVDATLCALAHPVRVRHSAPSVARYAPPNCWMNSPMRGGRTWLSCPQAGQKLGGSAAVRQCGELLATVVAGRDQAVGGDVGSGGRASHGRHGSACELAAQPAFGRSFLAFVASPAPAVNLEPVPVACAPTCP